MKAKNVLKEKWKHLVDFTFKMFENLLIESRLVKHSTMAQKQLPRHSEQIGVLKNFVNFTEKHLCWRLCLLKLQASRSFPLNNAKSLRVAFFIKQLRWLLLDIFWRCASKPAALLKLLQRWSFSVNSAIFFSTDVLQNNCS